MTSVRSAWQPEKVWKVDNLADFQIFSSVGGFFNLYMVTKMQVTKSVGVMKMQVTKSVGVMKMQVTKMQVTKMQVTKMQVTKMQVTKNPPVGPVTAKNPRTVLFRQTLQRTVLYLWSISEVWYQSAGLFESSVRYSAKAKYRPNEVPLGDFNFKIMH